MGTAIDQVCLDAHRFGQLVYAVFRFGFPQLVLRVLYPARDRRQEIATALRKALEKLGLTYLKLGQYLATRHDLVPPEFCAEMENLFECVAPMPWPVVRRIVEEELGAPVDELFQSFASAPIAAASIAQVHKACTRAGQWVAVKVQRPGIRELFFTDIRILRRIASAAEALGVTGTLSTVEAVDQVQAYTVREMDFLTEGRTAERLRQNLTNHAIVPCIHWNLSTQKVLTMDFIEGLSLMELRRHLDLENSKAIAAVLPSFDLEEVLHNLTSASLHQLFVTGFFHGDPHPGNIIVLRDNRVAFVDFGIFGELNPYQRLLLANYTASLSMGDIESCYRHISKIYFSSEASDEAAFQREVQHTLRHWYRASRNPYSTTGERHIGGAFDAMVGVVYRHRYRATMGYLLFWRAIIVLDSVAIRLKADFDLACEARTFFQGWQPDFINSCKPWRSLYAGLNDLAAAAKAIPAMQNTLMDGQTRIEVSHSTSQQNMRSLLAHCSLALILLSITRLSASSITRLAGYLALVLLALIVLFHKETRRA